MNQQIPFRCPIASVQVTIEVQTQRVSGIGSPAVCAQREYACSRENLCAARARAECPVRRLERHDHA